MNRHRLVYARRFGCNSLGNPLNASDQVALIYKKTGNLRAIQLWLGHTKMDSTVRYLSVELENALALAEAIQI